MPSRDLPPLVSCDTLAQLLQCLLLFVWFGLQVNEVLLDQRTLTTPLPLPRQLRTRSLKNGAPRTGLPCSATASGSASA